MTGTGGRTDVVPTTSFFASASNNGVSVVAGSGKANRSMRATFSASAI